MWILVTIILVASGNYIQVCSAGATCNVLSMMAYIEHSTCANVSTPELSSPSPTAGDTAKGGCRSLLTQTMTAFDYCPVSHCAGDGSWSIMSLSCGSSECSNGTSRDYTGRRTCTETGKVCQRWDAQSPHSHTYTSASSFPDSSLTGAGRYCRDPDGVRSSPWCYTTDPATEWETCGIPNCNDIDIGQGLCPNDYCGDPDGIIDTDNACALIGSTVYQRNVNSTRLITCQSLLQGFQSQTDYCPAQRCQADFSWTHASISCAENECYTAGQSGSYQGRLKCTTQGWPCQRWDQQTPHTHSFTQDSQYPDASVAAAGAYCRDPGGTRGAPWCYTTLHDVEWQFCSISTCDALSLGTGRCAPTTSTTTMASSTTVATATATSPTPMSITTAPTTTASDTTTTPATTTAPAATTAPVATTPPVATTAPATTTAPASTGSKVDTGLYRRENTQRIGFQKQYSVPYIDDVVHCAKLCLSQWMCVMITYDNSSMCSLYRQNPEVTDYTYCHSVQCFILNTVY